MSRYLVLVVLNLPLTILALISSLVDFKLGKISRRKYIIQFLFWIIVLAGLGLAKYIYEFLFSNNLTQTEPLSLFDVIQITGIITLLFLANRARVRAETIERRLQDLHQELSIRLSKKP